MIVYDSIISTAGVGACLGAATPYALRLPLRPPMRPSDVLYVQCQPLSMSMAMVDGNGSRSMVDELASELTNCLSVRRRTRQ